MELLRFITAGSVDDGKSTLIGRLLYDSNNVLADQLLALQKTSRSSSQEPDLALITDGLRAEREQGITIDVAYKYFNTAKRKFIVADAPGHVQYTRNMVTGASNADLIILLIDANNGITDQTRRHAAIAALLKIPGVIVAINKMDCFNYDQRRYESVKQECGKMLSQLGISEVHYIPLSALHGDNVVKRSATIHWYSGCSLMEMLEEISFKDRRLSFGCLSVQYVIRQTSGYRGYSGRVTGSGFRKADRVKIYPSEIETTISNLEKNNGETEAVCDGESIVLRTNDDIDISRGDLIVHADHQVMFTSVWRATICWMDNKPLKTGNKYLLQILSKRILCMVQDITSVTNMHSLVTQPSPSVTLNEIAEIVLKISAPLAHTAYEVNRLLGSFILIDENSNATVAAGVIL